MEAIRKLSDLKRDTPYRLTADDVDALLLVTTPGPTPLCILHGDVRDYAAREGSPPLLIQLIGWVRWGDDIVDKDGIRLFVADEQPDSAWLVGVRLDHSGTAELLQLACAPTITKREDDGSAS